jgi:hypothetical protein
VATATQIILATLPLYSQNATWRSSIANTVIVYVTDFPVVNVYVTDFPVVNVYVTDFPVINVYVTDFPVVNVHVDELSSA